MLRYPSAWRCRPPTSDLYQWKLRNPRRKHLERFASWAMKQARRVIADKAHPRLDARVSSMPQLDPDIEYFLLLAGSLALVLIGLLCLFYLAGQ